MSGLRAAFVTTLLVALAAACSLTTSLDGYTGGPARASDAGTVDASDASSPSSDAGADAEAGASLYRATVLADGPLAYYRLDDTGSVAKDEVGAHDGTYTGKPSRVPGAIAGESNGAASFDGTAWADLGSFLPASANAPFSIAGGVALLFGILSLTGVLGLIAGGGDHDADADTDVDADAEVDADADGHGDHDHDHDADGGRGFGAFVLGGMGVGRLPFSIVWQTFALVFAFTGLALNARYLGGAVPLVSLAWTVPISAASAYGVVALLARLLGPVLSTKEVEATSRAQLVGQIGVVISSTVTKSFGEIRIKDRTGHDLRVVVKLAEGSRPVLEKEQVVVVEHDGASDTLYVTPLETDLPASSRKRRVAADLADGDPEDDAPLDRTRTAR